MKGYVAAAILVLLSLSCKDQGAEVTSTGSITTDAALFELITVTEPFAQYTLFPRVDSVTSGTLNGSSAHQPLVRVRMNATALASFTNGRLPAGGSFRNGSIILKEILSGGVTQIYAVMYKDSANSLAGNNWLWAEFTPTGSVLFSTSTRGSGCVPCHSREQGTQHDFIRTFERQQ